MDDLLAAELITLASGLMGVAMLALGSKYRAAKKGLYIVNSNLKAINRNLADVSDLVDSLDAALEDDNFTTEEAREIVSKIKAVLEIDLPEPASD